MQVLKNVPADQLLKVNLTDASAADSWQPAAPGQRPLFKEITSSAGMQYTHRDYDFIDFNIQTTLRTNCRNTALRWQ